MSQTFADRPSEWLELYRSVSLAAIAAARAVVPSSSDQRPVHDAVKPVVDAILERYGTIGVYALVAVMAEDLMGYICEPPDDESERGSTDPDSVSKRLHGRIDQYERILLDLEVKG